MTKQILPPASPKSTLSDLESARLAELEPIIERGLTSFVEVGTALLEISDRRLYRATHSTFKEYVHEKWNMTAARAYQLCEAAEVVRSLPPEKSTIVDNEAQARELAKVPKEKRARVLEVAAATGKATAKAIKEAATESDVWCPECQKAISEDDGEPLYECDDCGEKFTRENSADGDSNRCPSCNKFGRKSEDLACPECGTELENAANITLTIDEDIRRAIGLLKSITPALLSQLQPDQLQQVIRIAEECQKHAHAIVVDSQTALGELISGKAA